MDDKPGRHNHGPLFFHPVLAFQWFFRANTQLLDFDGIFHTIASINSFHRKTGIRIIEFINKHPFSFALFRMAQILKRLPHSEASFTKLARFLLYFEQSINKTT